MWALDTRAIFLPCSFPQVSSNDPQVMVAYMENLFPTSLPTPAQCSPAQPRSACILMVPKVPHKVALTSTLFWRKQSCSQWTTESAWSVLTQNTLPCFPSHKDGRNKWQSSSEHRPSVWSHVLSPPNPSELPLSLLNTNLRSDTRTRFCYRILSLFSLTCSRLAEHSPWTP